MSLTWDFTNHEELGKGFISITSNICKSQGIYMKGLKGSYTLLLKRVGAIIDAPLNKCERKKRV